MPDMGKSIYSDLHHYLSVTQLALHQKLCLSAKPRGADHIFRLKRRVEMICQPLPFYTLGNLGLGGMRLLVHGRATLYCFKRVSVPPNQMRGIEERHAELVGAVVEEKSSNLN